MSKMKSELKYCYNCGLELTETSNHVEHIPAKNLFATYPEEYKINLLTVPACFTCNNKFSKIDQEIRDAIGVMNNDNKLQDEMSRKAMKSIIRKANWSDRLINVDDFNSFKVSFNYSDFRKIHIKHFKGLFYNKYGFPLPKRYLPEIIAEGDEIDSKLMSYARNLSDYANLNTPWQIIGHKDIFQYKIKSMIPNEDGTLRDGEDIENSIGFICLMWYHENIKPLVLAIDSDFSKRSITSHLVQAG